MSYGFEVGPDGLLKKSFGNATDRETGFGVNSEGFLSRRTKYVGKETQNNRKKTDGFRAQDDYDSEDRGGWVKPGSEPKRQTVPNSERVKPMSQLGPTTPKKPEVLTDMWNESTSDDASLRFK
jgi:hypothetical protein